MRIMNGLNAVVDWTAESFGGLGFIGGYNVITIAWVYLGLADPHFFDPFPSNFYTLSVSWLAINMSSLLLWNERRKTEKERSEQSKRDAEKLANEQHTMSTLMAILRLAEADAAKIPLIRQVAENQMLMLDYLVRRDAAENARYSATKR